MSAEPDLPEPVLTVIRSIHGGLRAAAERPSPTALADVAQGAVDGVTADERAKALAALARHPDGGTDPALYTDLATDTQSPAPVRSVAITSLAHLPPDRAAPAAVTLFETAGDDLLPEIISTLTVVGGTEAFAVLGDRFETGAGTLGDPATFEDALTGRAAVARAVIGHRHRLEDAPRVAVEGTDRTELDATAVDGATVSYAESLQDPLSDPLFGVTPGDPALELRFGEPAPPAYLVLDRAVTDSPADRLTSAPTLWGLVLTPDEEIGGYPPTLVGVATPTNGDEVAVSLMRQDGKAIYAGRGEPADGGLELTLSDTGLIGTMPTRLRLRLGVETITLADGVVDSERAVTRVPEPGID